MVNSFNEEVKALEEYGHDCCARIDDQIHECCKRIRETHRQELDNALYDYEVSMAMMKKQPSPVTYDVLGNERHKAVCELRTLPKDFGDIWVWKRKLGDAIGANEMYADIQSRLIYLLGGDQMPVTLGDMYGIWKGDGDGVDAGGRDEAGSVGTDASSSQCACSGRCGGLAEEVAPITTELREHLAGYKPIDTGDSIVVSRIGTIGYEKAMRLCDEIDAIHANLERENDELQRRTKYPAETERINTLEREVKRLESECKTQRNNFDQATSAREHWKNLYEQSLEQIHDLEHDVEMWRDRAEDMRMERDDALKEHHEWAPESHYMMLPKDADGIPVHIGDVMEWPDTSTVEVVGVYENGFFYVEDEGDIAAEWTSSHDKFHHAHETVEDVLREFALAVCKDDALTIRKGVVEEFAKRLTLAGDAE